MVELKDGPCKGMYLVKRAPVYLRAVIDKSGAIDVLDQIDDTPKDTERVYVYHQEGLAGTIHLHARDKSGNNISGWYAMANYHHMQEVDGEILRDNSTWQAWATKQAEGGNDAKRNLSQ